MSYGWEFKFDFVGVIPDQDLILSDMGHIRKSTELNLLRRVRGYKPPTSTIFVMPDERWLDENVRSLQPQNGDG